MKFKAKEAQAPQRGHKHHAAYSKQTRSFPQLTWESQLTFRIESKPQSLKLNGLGVGIV